METQIKDDCEYCGGTGWIQEDVFDPDSGRYMRGVGSRKCICQTIN